MSTIRQILCCCCYYLCDSKPSTEDSSPLLNPNDHSLNSQAGEVLHEGYQSFASPPRKPTASRSRPQTPDSAYEDIDTYQGAIKNSKTPPKGQYGQVPAHKKV